MEYFVFACIWYALGLIGTGVVDYFDRKDGIKELRFFSGLLFALGGCLMFIFAIGVSFWEATADRLDGVQ